MTNHESSLAPADWSTGALGMYGRLLPGLPPQAPMEADGDAWRQRLLAQVERAVAAAAAGQERADRDREGVGAKPRGDALAAGYTYLGQLIAHDVTFDPLPVGVRQVDPAQVRSYRTPSLDLDCLYGRGPAVDPHLYASTWPAEGGDSALARFCFPMGRAGQSLEGDNRFELDLPRRTRRVVPVDDRGRADALREERVELGQLIRRELGPEVDLSSAPQALKGPAWERLLATSFDTVSRVRVQVDADRTICTAWANGTQRFAVLDGGGRVHGRVVGEAAYDLYRVASHNQLSVGEACVADPRNDVNLLVAHVHLVWARFHNRVLADLVRGREEATTIEDFRAARRIVVWHYQWLVLHDYLESLVGTDVARRVRDRVERHPASSLLASRGGNFVPVEFAAGAFRAPHSMVREEYRLNDDDGKVFAMFDPTATDDLRGGRPLPGRWSLQWDLFLGDRAQPARPIGRSHAGVLAKLPPTGDGTDRLSLLERDVLRGAEMGLPSGQAAAKALGLAPTIEGDLPLILYALEEAEQVGGRHLGPVAGTIVAETLVGLVAGDRNSYLSRRPDWRPGEHEYGDDDLTFLDIVEAAGMPVTFEQWRAALTEPAEEARRKDELGPTGARRSDAPRSGARPRQGQRG